MTGHCWTSGLWLVLCALALASCGGGGAKHAQAEEPSPASEGGTAGYDPAVMTAPDHLALGHEAAKNKDYEAALAHFRLHADANPEDVPAVVLVAQAAMSAKDCEQALVFYEKAARMGANDMRVSIGVSHCSRALLESQLQAGASVEGETRAAILQSYKAFLAALKQRDWEAMAKHASPLALLRTQGSIPTSEQAFADAFDRYAAEVSSEDMTMLYGQILEPSKVVVADKIARVELEGMDGRLRSCVYLELEDASWKVVLFLGAIDREEN